VTVMEYVDKGSLGDYIIREKKRQTVNIDWVR
jgi:hypothetical protein